MRGWVERLRSKVTTAFRRPGRPDSYHGLRSRLLFLDLSTLAIPEGAPWGGAPVAVMEIALQKGTASIVAIADGTASMYVSTGGGVIGAGEHLAVRAVADRFRTVAAESRGGLRPTDDFPLPAAGEVRFQVRMPEGDYSGAAPEAALKTSRHPLAALYGAGQDLLTEIRLSVPE